MELLFLCLKIFFVRIIDVSMGTFRTIITVKGKSVYASIIGFIEVFIWFVIVKEALNTNETSIFVAISYALGYATGTFMGSLLSSKFLKGNIGLQVILSDTNDEIVNELRNKGYAVSVVEAKGQNDSKKYMLFMEINSKKYSELVKEIKSLDKNAFVVANESKYVINGYFQK